MSECKNTDQYIKSVCEQIRWKKAHAGISEELSDHIEDQKNTYLEMGQKEDEAEANAVKEMGDSVLVGQQLDRAYRPQPDKCMFAIIGFCMCINIIINYYLSWSANNASGFPSKPILWIATASLIGVGTMLITYFLDYSILGKYPKIIYSLVLVMCIALLGVMPRIYGAYFHVFYFCIILTTIYSGIIYNQRNKGYKGILTCGIFGIVTCAVFAIGNSIISIFMFYICGGVMLIVAISREWFCVNKKVAIAIVIFPLAIGITYAVKMWERTKSYFFVGGEGEQSAYILNIVRMILSNSKFIGQGGLDEKYSGIKIEGLLPLWFNDYSLTYMISKLGWIVAIALICLVGVLLVRMFKLVNRQRSQLGFIVSLGVVMSVMTQTISYICANLGLWGHPVCPLPLLSPGSYSLVTNMALMGVIMSTYRNNQVVRDRFIGKTVVRNEAEGLQLKIGKWVLLLRRI